MRTLIAPAVLLGVRLMRNIGRFAGETGQRDRVPRHGERRATIITTEKTNFLLS